jgi:Na+-transporting methylmalonyl-CoA/oxaloacetate decarboxylase gamma subunit
MTIITISLALAVLVLLYLLFRVAGRTTATRMSAEKVVKAEPAKIAKPTKAGAAAGEVNAAIAFAMHRYQSELSIEESYILTFNKVAKAYSPWSSKFYGLREIPNKKY